MGGVFVRWKVSSIPSIYLGQNIFNSINYYEKKIMYKKYLCKNIIIQYIS